MFNIPDPKDIQKLREDLFKTYNKGIETAILNTRFLYSTVKERPLIASDFDILKQDGANYIGSRVSIRLLQKVYLGLTHKQQETLLGISIKNSENIIDYAKTFFDTFYNSIVDYYAGMAKCITPEDIYKVLSSCINQNINVVFKMLYKRIKDIPAPIFKKIFMNLFNDDVDVSFIFDLILEEQQKKENVIVEPKQVDKIEELIGYLDICSDRQREKICLTLIDKFVDASPEQLHYHYNLAVQKNRQDILELILRAMEKKRDKDL